MKNNRLIFAVALVAFLVLLAMCAWIWQNNIPLPVF